MNNRTFASLFLLVCLMIPSVAICQEPDKKEGKATPQAAEQPAPKSVYDITVQNIDGKNVKLSDYRGQALMIVNIPAGCGCGQKVMLRSIETLYKTYKDRGLVVLGFPSDKPGEPQTNTNVEIKDLSAENHLTFPLFAKVSTFGKDMAPLYQFLTSAKTNRVFSGPVTSHFNEFIFDRDGKIVGRFEAGDAGIEPTIENALGAEGSK